MHLGVAGPAFLRSRRAAHSNDVFATTGEEISFVVKTFSFVASAACCHCLRSTKRRSPLTSGDDSIQLDQLTTPHLADACLRVRVPLRSAPHTMRPAIAGMTARGRVRPVRHV